MPVEFQNAQRRFRLEGRRIRRVARRLLQAVGRPEAELSILLVDDRAIRTLHHRWMGEDTATDVLSFPQGGPAADLLGDIVISVETAARRSPGRIFEETLRCLIHGLLHLVGYDHVRLSDRRRMERESRRLQRIAHAAV